MTKTFFVLWIWIGSGNTQTMAMDHFATLAECEAAKVAIAKHYPGYYGDKIKDNMVCLEAKVTE